MTIVMVLNKHLSLCHLLCHNYLQSFTFGLIKSLCPLAFQATTQRSSRKGVTASYAEDSVSQSDPRGLQTWTVLFFLVLRIFSPSPGDHRWLWRWHSCQQSFPSTYKVCSCPPTVSPSSTGVEIGILGLIESIILITDLSCFSQIINNIIILQQIQLSEPESVQRHRIRWQWRRRRWGIRKCKWLRLTR